MESEFETLKALGEGAYGQVSLVRKQSGPDAGQLYAMKVIRKLSIIGDNKKMEHAAMERVILEAVRKCPFVVTLYYAFQSKEHLYLILGYVNGGDLFTHLDNRKKFSEDDTRFYIGELILALDQLHKKDIIYRDLKPENVILDSEGHVVLTDFGVSKKFLPHEQKRAYSKSGTLPYMAPEFVKTGFLGHDIAVDWWSVGTLTFELLTGDSPFTNSNSDCRQEIIWRILNWDPIMPDDLSENARDFMKRLLVKDPQLRLGSGVEGVEAIKRHAFFTEAPPSFSWEALARREVQPPFVPVISHELDTRNFPCQFTRNPKSYIPAAPVMFLRYTYIEPSLMSYKIESTFHQYYRMDVFEDCLGDGASSVCRRCTHKDSGLEYAVKIVNVHYDCSSEVNFLRVCQGHPNIVDLHEVHQDRSCNYLVMELLSGGELLSRSKAKPFTEQKALSIMQQLASAIHFMHSQGVVHRDIKPENLVFAHSGEDSPIKLVDFGLAAFSFEALQTPSFTLPYAAPEVLAGKPYDEACDMWSLGAVMHYMLLGSLGEAGFDRGEIKSELSELGRDVLARLLANDPSERLTASDLLWHPWLIPVFGPTIEIIEISDDTVTV